METDSSVPWVLALENTEKIEEALKGTTGPWNNEPHYFKFFHKGFPCIVCRHVGMGQLNGYIGIPKGHPWYKKDYSYIDANVHGGLTFGELYKDSETKTVLKWIGFDCAHTGDTIPFLQKYNQNPGWESYKSIIYVTRELESLADQAKKAQKRKKIKKRETGYERRN